MTKRHKAENDNKTTTKAEQDQTGQTQSPPTQGRPAQTGRAALGGWVSSSSTAAALGAAGEVLERYRITARKDHDPAWISVPPGADVLLEQDGRAWVLGWLRVEPEDLGVCEICRTNAQQDPSDRLDDPWGQMCAVCADRVSEAMDEESVSLRRAMRIVRARVGTGGGQ